MHTKKAVRSEDRETREKCSGLIADTDNERHGLSCGYNLF